MAETKIDASVIVAARTTAVTMARKPNGSVDLNAAERLFDWIMAPVQDAAAERHQAQVENMAKARAARKAITEQGEAQSKPLTMRELANG